MHSYLKYKKDKNDGKFPSWGNLPIWKANIYMIVLAILFLCCFWLWGIFHWNGFIPSIHITHCLTFLVTLFWVFFLKNLSYIIWLFLKKSILTCWRIVWKRSFFCISKLIFLFNTFILINTCLNNPCTYGFYEVNLSLTN